MIDKIIPLLKRIWSLRDLRDKLIFTFAIVVLFRILAHIPLPGVDTTGLESIFNNNQILGMLDLFSGGSVSRFSIVMLGVGPYITASIVIQLLTIAIPALEQLQKEGEYGKQKINQYTRYLSIPLSIVESYGFIRLLQSQGILSSTSISDYLLIITISTAGSVFLMWLGELISERGIGNGISLLISAGIIAGIPSQIMATAQVVDNKLLIGIEMLLIVVLMIAFIVWMNQAERRVPVSYARRVRSDRTVGVIDSYLPIKANAAGVIPIIFATSMLVIPGVFAQFLQTSQSQNIKDIASSINVFLSNNLYYGILFFVLVFLFTFFYTSIIFQPKNIAENLQKQGGFIPGIRPGLQTSAYLSMIIYKVTFAGAFFLSIIAVFPFLMQSITGIRTLAIGGTGILIIVSVTLEFVSQVKSNLIMRSYDNFAS
ncbi:MAG: preprotein translocase subunit SecY [candidate division WS2 bacterium ADurb.Bin280]|uniref:Protein translocase subunit SecY n=1 Tax=candidate division WS2 bacterium ADurb.Bin280 TaxID=1852829 RepID=A0A1V5SC07_9BACT|nr:MAG: preprotein translocase subunit SecY [candidate division WS2 bacterium ADurb.Bin280]